MMHQVVQHLTVDDLDYHIKYGLHSNIPSCCVLEFVQDMLNGVRFVARARFAEFGVVDVNIMHEFQYVPCRTCMADYFRGTRKPAHIHVCAKDFSMECTRFGKYRK